MSANFFSMRLSSSPLISIIFNVDVVPLLISIDPFARPSVFSRVFITALLALPFSGRGFNFYFQRVFQPARDAVL